MIRIRVPELAVNILIVIWRRSFLQCSGEGQMYLPGGRKMEVIIRSVIIAGRLYVRNKREKNNIVRNV